MKQRQSYAEGIALYPWSFLGHHVQGFLVALALVAAPEQWHPVAWLVAGYYVAYQWLTQKRKGDSAGLDVLDFMVGAGIAIAFAVIFDVTKAHADGDPNYCPHHSAVTPEGCSVQTEPARGETHRDHSHTIDVEFPTYDDTALQDQVNGLRSDMDDLYGRLDDMNPQSEQHDHPYADDGHGHPDLEHDHPPVDLAHDHDGEFAEPEHEHDTTHTHTPTVVKGERGEAGPPGRDGRDGAPGQVLHYRPDWAAMAAAAGSIPYTADPLSIGASATSIGGANALAIGVSRRFDDWRLTGQIMTTGDELGVTVGAAIGLQP